MTGSGATSSTEVSGYVNAAGYVAIRMSQDTTFHLARADKVVPDWGGTVAVCGLRFGSSVGLYRGDEIMAPNAPDPTPIADLPFYRGRNEWTRCEHCNDAAERDRF